TPWNQPAAPFFVTPADQSAELSAVSASAAPYHPPVQASYTTCVAVVDTAGNMIDFFPMADIHDPNGHNW
ncbi:MAG: hypothetical protein ABIP89_11835, partial [Polyangiaceae bacterium]